MSYLRKTTAMAVMVAVVAVLAMSAAKAEDTQKCISKLADCADSLNSTKPSQTCCTSIKEAVTTDLPCLCNVYNTPGLLEAFNVTVDEALEFTKKCGVPTDLSQCNSTSPSPEPQPPSPVPGSDRNGAETIAWTGVSRLCVLFVSLLFY